MIFYVTYVNYLRYVKVEITSETERGREQCSTLAAEGVVSLQVVGAVDTRITSTTVDQRPTVTLTADHVTVT